MSTRRILEKVLILVLLLVLLVPELSTAASAAGTSTMYVKTDNGGPVTMR